MLIPANDVKVDVKYSEKLDPNFKLEIEKLNQQFNAFLLEEIKAKPYLDLRPSFVDYQMKLVVLCNKFNVKLPEPNHQFLVRNVQGNGKLPERYKRPVQLATIGGGKLMADKSMNFIKDLSAPIPNPFGNLNQPNSLFNRFNLGNNSNTSLFSNLTNSVNDKTKNIVKQANNLEFKSSDPNYFKTSTNGSTSFSGFGNLPLNNLNSIFTNQPLQTDTKPKFGSQPLLNNTSLLLPNQPILFGQVKTNLPTFNPGENPFKPFSSADGTKLMTPQLVTPLHIPAPEKPDTNKFGAGFNPFVKPQEPKTFGSPSSSERLTGEKSKVKVFPTTPTTTTNVTNSTITSHSFIVTPTSTDPSPQINAKSFKRGNQNMEHHWASPPLIVRPDKSDANPVIQPTSNFFTEQKVFRPRNGSKSPPSELPNAESEYDESIWDIDS